MTPLQDIRVLSVTVYLAGPFLSMTLARFGAEVIKVEAPGSGDPARNLGPFAGPRGIAHDRGAYDVLIPFLKRSEGVKCVTLNLKDAEGRRMFLDLAKKTDVLIENLAPGSMSRLGLGYGDVSAVNPGIVYCSIAGYGQSGPYKDLPAHDHQIQAMSGVMDMNGDPDGPPMRVGLYVADLVTPLYAALGIYGALRVKERTGKGQHIDASMIDTLAALMFMEPVEFVAAQGLPVRVGNRARDDVTGLYRLKDGDVFITIVNEGRWQRLCNTIGVAELIDDPRYATRAAAEDNDELARMCFLGDLFARDQADRAGVDERISDVARIELHGAVYGRNPHAVAVIAHSGNDAGHDAFGRQTRKGTRSPWPDAEPEDRDRDPRHHQGRFRSEGR